MNEPGRRGVVFSPGMDLGVEFLDSAGGPLVGPLHAELSVSEEGQRREIALQVTNHGSDPLVGAVRLRLDIARVSDPWWLIPGLFYGENRPADCEVRYPRFAIGAENPAEMVSSHWAFRADRAATPAVFCCGGEVGAALVAEERSALGMTGVGLAHDGTVASLHLTYPYREDPVSYDGSAEAQPAQVRTWTFAPKETVTLAATAYLLDGNRHGYADVLREVHARSASDSPITPWVTVAQAAEIAAHGLHHWHYDPDPGVLLETVGFDRGIRGQDGKVIDRQAMHVGWVSGIPWAYALLAHARRASGAAGSETETGGSGKSTVGAAAAQEEAAVSVIDFICSSLAPCGTFWGRWEREGGWKQSWSPVPGALHARTLGEATLFLLRAMGLGNDLAARPAWQEAARANLDVVAARQRSDGNLGSAHHAESGEVLSWSGAAGLIWVAAFCEAAEIDEDGRYLTAAERAGGYYARFIEQELIHGAPEDVDLAPSSEDGYAAVMAYVALHRRTGADRWLDLARCAADWMLTFRYTYNVTFDPRTTLGAHRFATRGADQASPPNQHLHAYGLVCTREMLELSETSGDPYYADRALEHLACFRQLVPRVDGELNAYRGMITERYYQTACFQPKGMLLTLSHAWSVGVLLLGCEDAIAMGMATVPSGGEVGCHI